MSTSTLVLVKNKTIQKQIQKVRMTVIVSLRPVAGGGAGGARAPPEIFRLELNSATKVEFFD